MLFYFLYIPLRKYLKKDIILSYNRNQARNSQNKVRIEVEVSSNSLLQVRILDLTVEIEDGMDNERAITWLQKLFWDFNSSQTLHKVMKLMMPIH